GEAEPAAGTFEEAVEVVQVPVPVNVTSRDGEPVRGLGIDDFEIYDQGRLRELVGFDVIDLEVLGFAEAEAKIEQLPAVARRHVLLLFDFSFSTPAAIVRARSAARDFVLQNLHPTDLVAVVTFSLEFGPRLLVTFTPDRAQLARAIDTIGLRRSELFATIDPLRFLVEPPSSMGSMSAGESSDRPEIQANMRNMALEAMRVIGKQMQRNEKSYERGRITAWSRALGDLAKSLNAISGRKQVIYFSEGFDSRLLLGREPGIAGGDDERDFQDRASGNLWMVDNDEIFGNVNLQNDVEAMLEEFRRADCTVQAVDIAGLRANVDASRGSGRESLFVIADGTGGQLFEDTNDLGDQLEKALQLSTVTYVLTFQPADLRLDGRYHRLRVKLKDQRGMVISYRAGYYEPRPYEGLHPLEKSLLAGDAVASAEPREDVVLDILTASFRASDESAYVPVIVEIDGGSLLTGQRADQLSMEIYAYVTDARGEMRDFFTRTVGLDISQGRQTILDSGVKYYGHLELAPGEYLLRVLVRNAHTGRTGVKMAPLTIPAWATAELTVLPPFFMDAPGKWLLVRERRGEGEGNSVVYPFTVNGEPYVPAARPVLQAEQPVEFCLVAYNLGRRDPGLRGWVVGSDGAEIRGGELALRQRTITGISGFDKLLAEFRPQGLVPGEYTLQVAVTDRATGSEELSSIPFVVSD
ncbi:MAG: VWA domain-containing protein, partial [bacterium]|nr:VWA domain-containing protein [bacterium]